MGGGDGMGAGGTQREVEGHTDGLSTSGSMRLIQRRVERLLSYDTGGGVGVAATPFKIVTSITDKDSSIKQTTQQVRFTRV